MDEPKSIVKIWTNDKVDLTSVELHDFISILSYLGKGLPVNSKKFEIVVRINSDPVPTQKLE